jgi:hypothetical protein
LHSARHKDLVKVTVKFIRRGTVVRKEREAFPVSHAGNGSRDSKWWPSDSWFYTGELGGNTHGQR